MQICRLNTPNMTANRPEFKFSGVPPCRIEQIIPLHKRSISEIGVGARVEGCEEKLLLCLLAGGDMGAQICWRKTCRFYSKAKTV